MDKFKEGDLVVDTQFKEIHQVQARFTAGGITFYNVINVSGPGAYQGNEIFEEKELRPHE
jgi:hypothetical protein